MAIGPLHVLRQGRDYGLVIGATFAFSLMALFTRAAAAPILTVAAWRAVVVALVFLVWAAVEAASRGEKPLASLAVDRPTRKLGALYGLALAVASSTFVGGYALTTVANTIFFHSLSPLAVFPLAWWLFKETPSPRALAGTGIAVLGVGLVSGVSILQFSHYADPRFLAGDILAFVSALGFGAVLVVTRAARARDIPILPLLTIAWGVAAALLCLVALAFGSLVLPVSAVPWVVGLAVISTNIPFYLLNVAMKRVPVGLASLLGMAEVVFATLLGLAVYGESLVPIGWVGGALIVLGILHPFMGGEEGEIAPAGALSEATQPIRWARLGLRLVLFNVGAGLVLVAGQEAGALLVWVALVSGLRLGQPAAAELAGARMAAVLRAGIAVLATAVLAGLGARGGWDDPAPALGGALLAAGVWIADRALLAREAPVDADSDPLASAALLASAVGIGLSAVGHPMGAWGTGGAVIFAALAALTLLLAAVRNGDPRRAAPALDAWPARLGRPRVLAVWVGLILVSGGIRVVPVGHVAVVERLGAPIEQPIPAGLLLRFPPPIERITLVDVARVRSLDLTGLDSALLTGDQSLVSAKVTLYYTVASPVSFALRVAAPEGAMRELGRGALAETVARLSLDDVLTTGRRDVEARVAAAAQIASDRVGLGVKVEAVQLASVSVPAPVQASFLDVISAEEHKRGLVNGAEAYAAQVVPKARGEAAAIVEFAAGDAASRTATAEGRAAWLLGVSRGGAASPRLTRVRLWRERVADALEGHPLVLVPRSVRVWLGGEAVTPKVVSPKPAPTKPAPTKPASAKPAAKPVKTESAPHG